MTPKMPHFPSIHHLSDVVRRDGCKTSREAKLQSDSHLLGDSVKLIRMGEALRVEREGKVAHVVLLGPGKGNAMGPEFWRECPAVFAELDGDPSIAAVIVRGNGEHFSYGLDLMRMAQEMGSLVAGPQMAVERKRLLAFIERLQSAFNNIEACRKPVIAAISGWCIGGGVDMISAADIRLASSDARFSVREVKVGMVADLGSLQRLPRIIGQGHTRELSFTGRNIDAQRAQRIGLVNEVYESPDKLLEGARALANEIADNSPLVVEGIKSVLNAVDAKAVREGLHEVALYNTAFLQSNDLGEAFAAFAERRPPRYSGT